MPLLSHSLLQSMSSDCILNLPHSSNSLHVNKLGPVLHLQLKMKTTGSGSQENTVAQDIGKIQKLKQREDETTPFDTVNLPEMFDSVLAAHTSLGILSRSSSLSAPSQRKGFASVMDWDSSTSAPWLRASASDSLSRVDSREGINEAGRLVQAGSTSTSSYCCAQIDIW